MSWQPPNGGGQVTGYRVTVSPSAPGSSQTATGATSVRVTGLACGTTYSFTVFAVGTGGQQVPAQPVTAQVTCPPPGAPTGLNSSVSSHQVQLNWSAPSGGASSYNVSWNGGSQTGITGTSDTISGLTNFQSYTFTVTAVNQSGAGGSASTQVNLSPGTTWGYNITNNWIYSLNVRSGPGTSYGSIGSFPPTPQPGPGPGIAVICQQTGGWYTDPTGSGPSGNVWDEISYGGGAGWVADGYTTTPNSSANAPSPPIWPCQ